MGTDSIIIDVINRYYNSLKKSDSGGPNSRFRSWEYCHKAFSDKRKEYNETKNNEIKDGIVDELSLHLAFYLASWGMYRGSSFLLQRDYKAHRNAVGIILEDQYNNLWDYKPFDEGKIEEVAEIIFKKDSTGKCLYEKIISSYNVQPNDKVPFEDDNTDKEDLATDTLVTKILMGTFGCMPAFDRFLKAGISIAFTGRKPKYKGLTIVKNYGNLESAKETFMALSNFVKDNSSDFSYIKGYPQMKLLDMYLWELGYEKELSKELNKDLKDEKKKSIVNHLIRLGFNINENDSKEKLIETISGAWPVNNPK